MKFHKIIGILILSTLFIATSSVYSQIGSIIPESRRTNWEDSGYMRNSFDNLPIGRHYVISVKPPTGNPKIDYENIHNSIQIAGVISHFFGLTNVMFESGEYVIDKTIELGPRIKNIILTGSGAGKTTIKKWEKSNSSTIIKIEGKRLEERFHVVDYNEEENVIILKNSTDALEVGDFVDIQVPNGSWHNSIHSKEKDLLGHVVEIEAKISPKEYKLKDDFALVWELAKSEELVPYMHKLLMVENLGFEKMTLTPDSEAPGNIFEILYAKDVWFRELETFSAVNAHFQVSYSTQLEFRRNYIHHGKNYGVGGHGYGIEFIRRTTNSLVEDNIFQSLRHAMIIARGANRNVFGYNYSREQKDSVNNVLSDINLHGNFPFLNLFEGNWVDRIHADSYHGTNGYFNTFVRNHSQYRQFKIDDSDYSNILGNEAKLYLKNSRDNLDYYAEGITHVQWNRNDYKNSILSDVSYYKVMKPDFMTGYSWPVIGPRASKNVEVYKGIIPARDRYCSEYPKDC